MDAPEITRFLTERMAAGDFPSAAWLVSEKGDVKFEGAIGMAVIEPEPIPAKIDTIYDLASLTKPLVTALLIAKLIEKGEIALSDKVSKFFTEFDISDKREITLLHLLTHSSGLPAWKPFYLIQETFDLRDELIRHIGRLDLAYETGTKVIYSDPNFLTLTLLLEKLHGKRIDEVAKTEVFTPLGLENTFYNPPASLKPRIAASETGNNYEKQTCIEEGFDVSGHDWREYVIWGEVHDGNAWALDGASGHAGLFSNVADTHLIAQQFLPNYTRILGPETCKLFSANITVGLNEGRSVGFQTAFTRDAAGDDLPEESFGHSGFTGTSAWIDPAGERIYILLTNRTHSKKMPFVLLNSVRREFHSLSSQNLHR